MDDKGITITMEEYKELLIIKGKYEELKSQQFLTRQNPTLITDLSEKYKIPETPYKLTCKEE